MGFALPSDPLRAGRSSMLRQRAGGQDGAFGEGWEPGMSTWTAPRWRLFCWAFKY